MQYPLRVALITFDVVEDNIDLGLEASMVYPIEAFDTNAVYGFRFDTAIIAWSTLYTCRPHMDAEEIVEVRKRLVDWVNLNIAPRITTHRKPVWL